MATIDQVGHGRHDFVIGAGRLTYKLYEFQKSTGVFLPLHV
jgi:hypothetical protein